jgi:hypothetical protein
MAWPVTKGNKEHIAMTQVPDAHTLERLQRKYAAAVLARGDLPPEVLVKFQRMQELTVQLQEREDPKIREEVRASALELAPHFGFHVDDVDWDKQWDEASREFRHRGLVVRLDD